MHGDSAGCVMADVVDKATRSRMMSGIRAKDTSPELRVRSMLHRAGFRFRLHRKDLAGKPDIVLPRYCAAIFVNGCYWHRCPHCNYPLPKHNKDFWKAKFERNVARDKMKIDQLHHLGWKSVVVWECEIKKNIESTTATLKGEII